jgi:hypothetical protein
MVKLTKMLSSKWSIRFPVVWTRNTRIWRTSSTVGRRTTQLCIGTKQIDSRKWLIKPGRKGNLILKLHQTWTKIKRVANKLKTLALISQTKETQFNRPKINHSLHQVSKRAKPIPLARRRLQSRRKNQRWPKSKQVFNILLSFWAEKLPWR